MPDETALVRHTLPDIRELLAGQLAASSIKVYRESVAQYARFATERQMEQFDAQTLVLWRDHLTLSTRQSPNTINRKMSAIRRTVKEAAARRMISSAVAYDFSLVEKVKVRALRSRLKQHSRTRIFPQDMRRLCESPGTTTLLGLRDTALLHTLATSGLRISELVSLTAAQIERRGEYYVMQVTGKTDIEARDVHISAEAYGAIQAWLQARPVASDYIFTGFAGSGQNGRNRLTAEPITRQGAWVAITGYAQACGLAHLKPHDFRRFLGTELTQRGNILQAQKALGHKSIATTQKYYVLTGLEPGLTDNLY